MESYGLHTFVQILSFVIVCELSHVLHVDTRNAFFSFLLLCSILLFKYTPIYLSILLMVDLMAVPALELLDNAARNTLVHLF